MVEPPSEQAAGRGGISERLTALLSSGVVRSIGVLVGGAAMAHGITALSMPISTRLFSPQDFSAAAAFSSLVATIVTAACLRFEMAIPLPEGDEEAANLLGLAILSAIGSAVLLAAILIALPRSVLDLLRQPALMPYLWLLPVTILIGAAYLALQMWFVRRKAFGPIARSRVLQSAAAASGQIGLGAAGIAPLGLIFGQMLNYGAGSLTLGFNILRNERELLRKISVAGMRSAFRAYHRFPRYSIWEALANAASINVPILLIAALAIGPEAGYLTLAIFLLQAPMALLGNAVGQVYLSGAPEALREGRIRAYTSDILAGLMRTIGGPLLFLAIVSPTVFGLVFGPQWTRAGVLVTWMAPWFLMQFLAAPVSTALHVSSRQRTALILQLFGLALRVGSVIIAGLVAAPIISEAYAVSGFVFYTVYVFAVMRVVGLRFGDLAAAFRRALPLIALAGAAALGIVVAVRLLVPALAG